MNATFFEAIGHKPEPTRHPIYDEDGDPDWNPKKKKAPFKNLHTIKRMDLLDKAFAACHTGRKNFGDKNERTMWNRIERKIDSGDIPEQWVLNCIDFADKKNSEHITLLFKNLLVFILNAEKMKDWLAKQKLNNLFVDGEIYKGKDFSEEEDGSTVDFG